MEPKKKLLTKIILLIAVFLTGNQTHERDTPCLVLFVFFSMRPRKVRYNPFPIICFFSRVNNFLKGQFFLWGLIVADGAKKETDGEGIQINDLS